MRLSKSKFLQGHQCRKLLWFACNTKEVPEPDAAQQAILDQGKQVGDLAKTLYPGGVEVGAGVTDFEQVLQRSLEAMKTRLPLFEASFVYNGGLARADILLPVGRTEWDIIEVKSSTEIKDVNLLDLAFRAFVYHGAGLHIRRCCVMHVNSEYVRHGAIDPKKFFKLADVTKDVSALSRDIEPLMEDMFSVIRRKQSPDIQIGPHCSYPYPCPLQDKCWAFLPEQNVTTLYRAGKKAFKLLADGIVALKDIPEDFRLTANQKIQRQTAASGKPHVDRTALAAFLSQLQYPLSYLDFETLGTAIPLFDGAQPYEQIPFQFSLHVIRSAGAKPEHHGFLAEGRNDPRPEFVRRLHAILPDVGSVIVYNAAFEQGRLEECCHLLPEYEPWCRQVKRRMVDLLLPFRGFRYHHPAQHGSNSMKAVLPALTGHGYEHLEIQEGGTASLEYLRVTHGAVPEAERQKVRAQLERYCGLDTEGMVWIIDALRQCAG